MCIVTGPRIDLAIALIDRMKRLFTGKGLVAPSSPIKYAEKFSIGISDAEAGNY